MFQVAVSSFLIDTTTTGVMIFSIWENPCRSSMATNGTLWYLPNLSYPEGSDCIVRQPPVPAYTCIRSVMSSKLVGLKPLLTLLCLNLKRKYLLHTWAAISQSAGFLAMCFLSLVNPRRFPRPSHTSNIQIISNHHKSISLQRELGHGVVKFQMHWGIFFRYFHVCQVTLQTALLGWNTNWLLVGFMNWWHTIHQPRVNGGVGSYEIIHQCLAISHPGWLNGIIQGPKLASPNNSLAQKLRQVTEHVSAPKSFSTCRQKKNESNRVGTWNVDKVVWTGMPLVNHHPKLIRLRSLWFWDPM